MSYKNKALEAIKETTATLENLPEETLKKLIVDIKGRFQKMTGSKGEIIHDYYQSWDLYIEILQTWVKRITEKSNDSGFPIAQAALRALQCYGFESHGHEPNVGDMLYYIITDESPEHFLNNKRTLGTV